MRLPKNIMPRVFGACCLMFCLVLVAGAATGAESKLYRVRRVIDGDTIELTNRKTVRYIGVDTPETKQYHIAKGWVEDAQAFGKEAAEYNRSLVEGKDIRLEFGAGKKDQYGRWLAYCFVGDVFVNARLLEQGYAFLYTKTPNTKYVDILAQSFKKAKDAHVGIWSIAVELTPQEAALHLGEVAWVEGVVSKVKSSSAVVSIFFGPLAEPLVRGVIFQKDAALFAQEGFSGVTGLKGRRVRILGILKQYQGRPEIIIRHPAQLEVVP